MGRWLEKAKAIDPMALDVLPTELMPIGANSSNTAEQEQFEERAAIAEYDGGLSRTEAEELARKSLRPTAAVIPFAPRQTVEAGRIYVGNGFYVGMDKVVNYTREHAKQDGMVYCFDCRKSCKLDEKLQPHRLKCFEERK